MKKNTIVLFSLLTTLTVTAQEVYPHKENLTPMLVQRSTLQLAK